jgi:hypothetical protein
MLDKRVMRPTECPLPAVRHQAYERAYQVWFESLAEHDQRALARIGLDKPESEQFGPVREDEPERSTPEAGAFVHPADAIEGTIEDESELAATFGEALAWCSQGSDVVDMGRRLTVVLHLWRPSLVAGMTLEIEREMTEEFRCWVQCDAPCDRGNLGPVLEWARRGTSLGQLGQRVLAMTYVLKPHAIGAPTLAAIGALTNKTRQAVDKLVQDFRDTFGGVKSRNMRSEANRITCRHAQYLRT